MCYHTYGCANQYSFSSNIHLLLYLDFKFYVIIDREVGAPVHAKDYVDGLNDIYKLMIRSATVKLLDNELIQDDPTFQIHAGS